MKQHEMNETLDIIKRRRSVRQYTSEQIDERKLHAVLESALYAPYANEEDRHFAVVQNRALLQKLDRKAKEAAVQMDIPHLAALGKDEDFCCLYGAPTLILLCGRENGIAPETDCAVAAQNILIAAESLGVATCYLYFVTLAFCGIEAQNLRKECAIPDGYNPICGIILGYAKGDIPALPEKRWNNITFI